MWVIYIDHIENWLEVVNKIYIKKINNYNDQNSIYLLK
jgi:hypothetical protein